MKYFSLNNQSPSVTFKEATFRGQAPDKGLYFPESIPVIERDLIENIGSYADDEIAYQVIKPYIGDEIPAAELRRIVRETIAFPIPLVNISKGIYSLELYHGPTLAFKDVGARFMSRCLGYFSSGKKGKTIVLVATSGDTGGAVANGFHNVDSVEVVILFPSGKVSAVQEKQLTTLGNNIHALEITGNFDDCQLLVKQAFADADLNRKLFLTSANSINVARWLPQQFYYFLAYKQWQHKEQAPVFSVPSGNFGNICAGILAHISGMPATHFIAACNVNDVVPQYLLKGLYEPRKAIPTLSNAMDVGDPSNFVRILQIFDQDLPRLRELLSGFTITDEETRATIRRIKADTGYLLDPHGAVGFLALERWLQMHPGMAGIFLETAHPVKFFDVVEPLIGESVPIPSGIASILHKPGESRLMKSDHDNLKEFLLGI